MELHGMTAITPNVDMQTKTITLRDRESFIVTVLKQRNTFTLSYLIFKKMTVPMN